MFWCLDLDDFKGVCGEGKYPLITAVSKELGGYTPPRPNTPGPRPSTEKPVATKRPLITRAPPETSAPGGRVCKAIGPWAGNTGMNAYCKKNCAKGHCPAKQCKCT